MNSTFGTRLRVQRERQQISLVTIAEQTKIKLSLLEALERDDISHWPLGIFGRSYIRSYAQAVGLDPATTVREFIESLPPQAEAVAPPLEELRDAADKAGRRPPTRLEVLIDSALDAFHARRNDHAARTTRALDQSPAQAPEDFAEAPIGFAYSPEDIAGTSEISPPSPPAGAIDLSAVAHLCTRLGCVTDAHEVTGALEEAAAILDAVGLILWMPDVRGVSLTAVFAHGYPDELIAHLPRVSADADNASAEAFRTRTTCVVDANDLGTGAVVAPLLTPAGCGGVLAVEVRGGAEQREDVRAAVTILAAQMSTLVGYSALAQTLSA